LIRPNGPIILGINCAYHESAAALIRDGRIIAAVEEERFSGHKHGKPVRVDNAHRLPWTAIEYCLDAAGINWHDLDAVSYSLDPALRRRNACLGNENEPPTFGHPVGEALFQESLRKVPALIAERTDAAFFFVPHHAAHAWYAMGTSPFDRAAVLVADGVGERASLSLGVATRSSVSLEEQAFFPASIGIGWEKVARFMGLTEYDACKVMALAGLNNGVAPEPFERLMAYRDDGLWLDQGVLGLEFPDDFSGLSRYFGPRGMGPIDSAENRRLAAGIQRATEQVLLAIAAQLVGRYGERRLVYGGGVALNCRATAVLAASGIVDNIHVGPAAHDAGTALGAAWYVHASFGHKAVPCQDSRVIVYSGPAMNGHDEALRSGGWRMVKTADPLADVVDLLTRGEMVGWLEGRCEFGPRALGARSVLASPLVEGVVARVNQAKGRATFEPLAVSVLAEEADNVFDLPVAARGLADLMLTTAVPTYAWRVRLHRVLHGDGTTRVQIVRRETAPRFHELLHQFALRTGVPLLVNTSFNPRGEPMPAMLLRALSVADTLGVNQIAIDGRLFVRAVGDPVESGSTPEGALTMS
jgi:carbamoyltransferase